MTEVDEYGTCHDCGLTWHDGRQTCSHHIAYGESDEVVTRPLELE